MLGPGVADRNLAAAAPAANEPGEQGIAVLGRSVMPARGNVVAAIARIASARSQLT